MKLARLREILPTWKGAALAVLAAVLLILAFPDFDLWFLAWFALVPLIWAIEREKGSVARGFMLGWIFGTVFFFGTCWWLTFAPITYAGFPPALAYFLLLFVCIAAGIFPAIFGGMMAFLIRRFGSIAILAGPFVWVFTEFVRYWITGNNWNAIGYSQAFVPRMIGTASMGGVYPVGFLVLLGTVILAFTLLWPPNTLRARGLRAIVTVMALAGLVIMFLPRSLEVSTAESETFVIALQPNVPMSGLNYEKWRQLRQRHIEMAENVIRQISANPQSAIRDPQLTVVFPESPMNFMYDEDREFQAFIHDFARRNSVNVLFNSAEPNHADGKYFNSAVMVSSEGREIQQYDKIYLVPFGESVPFPLQSIVPAFVGSFSYGSEHRLFPLGEAKAGVMICFESHFGELSRQYVLNGADAIIEMTNDGYLGPTPVLRQHLANAVFRAVETNRPVLRVTNVGITAYINERGEVLDPAPVYSEDTRVWSVPKSDGRQTFYVRYGDWFAWVCSLMTFGLLAFAFVRSRKPE